MDDVFEIYRKREQSQSIPVLINQGQVLRITVAELMSKYKAHRNNPDYAPAFETILRGFYLTDGEFDEMIAEIEG